MRSWTEQHSNHVSQNRAAQKKSLVTRVTSAFQPIAVTARLSHATHHRLAPSWVGDLNEKLPLGRGTAEFSFTRIFSATVQSLPAEPQSHKQLGFYILYDYLPQPKKKLHLQEFCLALPQSPPDFPGIWLGGTCPAQVFLSVCTQAQHALITHQVSTSP